MHVVSPIRTATVLFAFVLCTLAACGGSGDGTKGGAAARGKSETSNGTVDIPRTSYHVTALGATGSVQGQVTADGDIPEGGAIESDSSLAAASTAAADCRTKPAAAVLHTGPAIGNVVVWIADVQTGKAMPVEKRLEVTQVGCELEPRVQVAVTGSTVNVRNADKGVHWIATHPVGASDTTSLDRFNDDGQVVPDDRLAKAPGMMILQCHQHPTTRAFVAVFDHPYATVTGADGRFTIDSLPPGHYRLMVWHERSTKPVERAIDVAPSKTVQADVKIRLK